MAHFYSRLITVMALTLFLTSCGQNPSENVESGTSDQREVASLIQGENDPDEQINPLLPPKPYRSFTGKTSVTFPTNGLTDSLPSARVQLPPACKKLISVFTQTQQAFGRLADGGRFAQCFFFDDCNPTLHSYPLNISGNSFQVVVQAEAPLFVVPPIASPQFEVNYQAVCESATGASSGIFTGVANARFYRNNFNSALSHVALKGCSNPRVLTQSYVRANNCGPPGSGVTCSNRHRGPSVNISSYAINVSPTGVDLVAAAADRIFTESPFGSFPIAYLVMCNDGAVSALTQERSFKGFVTVDGRNPLASKVELPPNCGNPLVFVQSEKIFQSCSGRTFPRTVEPPGCMNGQSFEPVYAFFRTSPNPVELFVFARGEKSLAEENRIPVSFQVVCR